MANLAFSIDWFMTVPGILISVGVLLLIIALIIFIVSASKDKKTDKTPSVLEETNKEPEVSTVEEVKPVEPVNVQEQTETPLIDTVSEEVIVPSFEGDATNPTNVTEKVEEVKENNFIPADLGEMVMPETPVAGNNEETIPTETIKEETFEIPEPISEVEHRPIYGGADPLEATQNLPKIDVHHEPYSGGAIETHEEPKPIFDIQEPVAKQQEVITPVVEPTPIVEPTPAVETEKVEVPVQPEPQIISIPDDDDIEEL